MLTALVQNFTADVFPGWSFGEIANFLNGTFSGVAIVVCLIAFGLSGVNINASPKKVI